MLKLNTPLKSIPRITPAYAKLLSGLGLLTVKDLLLYFPFRYDDFSKIVEISEEHLGETITIEGTVKKIQAKKIWKRKMTIIEAVLEDQNGTALKAIWFNQMFVLSTVKDEATVRLSGKLELKGRTFQMVSPSFERAARDATNTGRLVPVYSETKGLTSKWLRWQLKTFLPLAKQIPEVIPKNITEKFHLYSFPKAIREIHFPTTPKNLERAQKTLAFQEMFLIQMKALQVRSLWLGKKSNSFKFSEKNIQKFTASLPFKLTDAQRKAAFEILKDLEKTRPMNRLLNGDVGSGKTVVAALASLPILENKNQVAIMAPTEVLAKQHFESFCQLFKDYPFNIGLLTNSYKLLCHPREGGDPVSGLKVSTLDSHRSLSSRSKGGNDNRKELLEKMKSGQIDLIIGTHALIQKDVAFKNLSLVIIDEQHRFGVAQRAHLQDETMRMDDGSTKNIPHLLTMTATPIPRSLAIAFFGSLDLSILDEMPKNRKPIKTQIIPPLARAEVYNFIREEIRKGRQVFIILPLVEKSESLKDVKAVKEEHARLAKDIFPEFKLGLLHGKMKPKEKEAVMQEFSEKKIDILVSTSVVEVGIDIPNASVIVIEHADRFGLSQLHQFRGRVGRGEHQSYCFLMTDSEEKSSNERLLALEKTNDGFKIAEEDLKLRGPGQFFGTLQSGLPDITMENLANLKLIKFARAEATQILKTDPTLKNYPEIKKALRKFEESVHLE
ncbi:MAG: ATP-dependent DNA helicase RecG [Patescibacteria group bacterium]